MLRLITHHYDAYHPTSFASELARVWAIEKLARACISLMRAGQPFEVLDATSLQVMLEYTGEGRVRYARELLVMLPYDHPLRRNVNYLRRALRDATMIPTNEEES